jgi:parallel beta-helix repeat protein
MHGVYTIDSSRTATASNYKNFQNAVSDLVNGKRADGGNVNGPGIDSSVYFKVASGLYYEKIAIKEISGTSTVNTVTFNSALKDSNTVILIDTNSSSPVNNYTLYLDGADHIIFRDITIQRGGSGNYANVIQVDNQANDNSFLNDAIIGRPATVFAYPYSSLVYSVGSYPYSTDSGNIFKNNLIKYGYYAFSWYANSINPENGTVIESNTLDSQYYGGIFMGYQSGFIIRGNIIQNLISPYATGIFSSFSYLKNLVWGNKIIMPNGGQGLEMEFNQPSSLDTSLVANNFISIGGAAYAGLYAYGGDCIKFYNNNVLLYGSSPYSSFAASMVSTYYSGSHFILKNNILVNLQSGASAYSAYYYNKAVAASDYNDLYVKGSRLGNFNSSAYKTLAAWRKNTGLDSHSVFTDPGFASFTDLHITNTALNAKALPVLEVPTDIDLQKRDSALPDIGADEIFPVNNDAGLTAIDSPVVGCNGSRSVYVRFKNFGLRPISNVTISWQVDTNKIQYFYFSGKVAVSADTLIKTGTYTFTSANKASKIKAWTSLPNGVSDSINANDTAIALLHQGLSGNYTIGGPGGFFATFGSAVDMLNKNGVCGSVTFNIRDGIYNEQVRIGPVAGTSSSSKILFQSQSGDSSKVILRWPATNIYSYNNNYVLNLSGVSWVQFKNLTIARTGIGYYGNAINIERNSAGIIISNNILSTEVIPIASYTNYSDANVIYSIGENKSNSIINNYIKGGSYNLYSKGAVGQYSAGININGNIFDSSFWGSAYLQYLVAPILQNNTIINLLSNYSYGITLYNTIGPSHIQNNRIRMPKGGGAVYLGYGAKGSASGRILVANNFITLAEASGYNDAGIMADYCDSIDIIYNNIYVTDPSKKASAIYINSLNSSLQLFNNNFINTGGGYAINVLSGTLQASSNNNLFTGKNAIGYFSGSKAYSLADWQNSTSMDSGSISVDPLYYSARDLHVGNSALDGAAIPIPAIRSDIDGDKRNPVHPDIGADEFSPYKNNAGIAGIDSPATGFCGGLRNVYIRVRNYGTDTLKSLSINWEINGVKQAPTYFKGYIFKGNEALVKLGSVSFPVGKSASIFVYCSNPNGLKDSQPANDSVLRIFNSGLNGTYTIGGKFYDYHDFNSAASELATRGLCGAVIFNVRNGIYEEQISIGQIPGLSSQHNIVFQSQSGDSTTVILDFPATSNLNNNYTLQLNGARFTTFRNMTFSRSGLNLASNVIAITGESSDNIFTNNRITGIKLPFINVNSYYYSSALVFSAPSNDNRNSFINNNLSGNFWGFYFLGTGIGASETGTIIRQNIIDSSYAGIFLQYQDSTHIENNIIKNLKGSYFGIQAYYMGASPVISKNRISMPNGGYGLYSFYLKGDIGQPALISNNVISIKKYGSGMYSAYSDYVGFYYNTVVTNTRDGFASASFQGAAANSCELYNNIFISRGSGPALSGGAKIITASDNNDLLSSSRYLAAWDTSNASSLVNLQKLSRFDTKSLSADPMFIDTISFHISKLSPVIHKALAIASIATDIDGQARNPVRPDIGADEVNPFNNDLAMIGILSPVQGVCGSLSDILTVRVRNEGLNTIRGYKIIAIINGKRIADSVPASASLAPGLDTILTFATRFSTYSGGNYAIKAFTALVSDSNNINDTIKAILTFNPHLPPPIARDGNICGSGYLTLKAHSSDSISWFDSLGSYLTSGDSLNTGFLSHTQKYSVKALPRIHSAGLFSPDKAGGYNPSADMRAGLLFDALANITLDSITLYPEKSGLLVLNVRDSTGKAIGQLSSRIIVNNAFEPLQLYVHTHIPMGNNYTIDALNSEVGSLYANGVNSIGRAKFPFTVPGFISIKNNIDYSGNSGKYFYFYNWKVTHGFACESIKKQVHAVVGQGTKPQAGFKNGISCNGTALFTDTSRSTGTPLLRETFEFGDTMSLTDTVFLPVKHYYKRSGSYIALLTITTTGGCTDTVSHFINIFPDLRAGFTKTDGCIGTGLKFIDSSYSVIKPTSYSWDFGDGDSSSVQSPVHTYYSAGVFKVQLTINSSLCTDTVSHSIKIRKLPVISFTYAGQCLGNPTNFINKSFSTDSIAAYYWLIDSTAIVKKQLNYTFSKPGIHRVLLTGKSIYGCLAKDSMQILIHPTPDARFTYMEAAHLHNFIAEDSTLTGYTWNFGDSSTSNMGYRVSHEFHNAAPHIVSLKVIDSNACTSEFDTLVRTTALGIRYINASGFSYAISPNPVKDFASLYYILSNSAYQYLQLQDVNGKLLSGFKGGLKLAGEHSEILDLSAFPPGVYILKIISDSNSYFIKIMKL